MRTRRSFKCCRCNRWTLNADWCGHEPAVCKDCWNEEPIGLMEYVVCGVVLLFVAIILLAAFGVR